MRIDTLTLFKWVLLLGTITTGHDCLGQSKNNHTIDVSVGLGLASSYYEGVEEIRGTGFYAQGEYVFGPKTWFELRPYAGFIFTSPDNENLNEGDPDYEVTSDAFMIGGKFRLIAPIPYIAPYFELGIGASIGSFRTFTPESDIDKSGVQVHIPITLGADLGKNQGVGLKLIYYVHPGLDQVSGAAAIGVSIPLRKNT